jgi:HlyD family secretion protein
MNTGALPSKRSGLTRPPVIIAAAVVAAVVLALVVKTFLGGGSGASERATFAVKRGPLDVKIVQTGELQAAESLRIIPEIRAQATIVSIVDEGTRVKKGDVIVQLDSSSLEDAEGDQAIEVENAKANLIRAEEEKKIQELQNQTNIASARLSLDNARMDLDKYGQVMLTPGGFLDMRYYPDAEADVESSDAVAAALDPPAPAVPVDSTAALAVVSTDAAPVATVQRGQAFQSFRDAELAIERATTDLEKARMDFDKMDELVDKGFVTKNDYLEDQLKVVEAERKLESARLAHFILRTYEHPKNLARYRADVRQREDQFKQAELSAGAQMAQRDANIAQAKATFDRRNSTLAETRDRIAKMTITAPDDGLVLYGDERRPMDKENIKVGGRANEGSVLVTFPSVGRLIAATKVPEKDIYRVRPGMPAEVTAPALVDVLFTGKVSKISSVASTTNRWMAASEAKVFDVEIPIDQPDARVKPGMSCRAEILIATIPDCLYVPVNCVFKQEGRDTCTVVSGSAMASRAVTLGETNDIYVQVTKGLDEGDRVLLYSVAPSEVSVAPAGAESDARRAPQAAPDADAAAAPPFPGGPSMESTDSGRRGRRRMGGEGFPMDSSDAAAAFQRFRDGGMVPPDAGGMGAEGASRRGGRMRRDAGDAAQAPDAADGRPASAAPGE